MSDKMTFKQARQEVLDKLKAAGWKTNEFLKIPWAESKDYNVKYYFKAQAVYSCDAGESFKECMSTWYDHKIFLENIDNVINTGLIDPENKIEVC